MRRPLVAMWTAAQLPDMTGRTVIVTGGARGLGQVTARELARVGARVVLAVRDPSRAAPVAAAMDGRVEVRQLDVADLGSVRRFAAGWSGDIDVLVNNAGIMNSPLALTADGFESQAATNYLGPFTLTTLLLPHVTDRVVSVSSQLHRQGEVHLQDLPGSERPYKAGNAYNDSKLRVVLFSTELQRRLTGAGSPVRSIVAHPGIASTELATASTAGKITHALRFLFNDVERGALSILFAATQDVPGNAYVGPDGLAGMRGHPAVGRAAAAGLDRETARQLWDATEQLVAAHPSGPGPDAGTDADAPGSRPRT